MKISIVDIVNELILWDKYTALFQTHNWEKSSFFNDLVRGFARFYANKVLVELTGPP